MTAIDSRLIDIQDVDDVSIENAKYLSCHRTHRQFFLSWHAQLADKPQIHRAEQDSAPPHKRLGHHRVVKPERGHRFCRYSPTELPQAFFRLLPCLQNGERSLPLISARLLQMGLKPLGRQKGGCLQRARLFKQMRGVRHDLQSGMGR